MNIALKNLVRIISTIGGVVVCLFAILLMYRNGYFGYSSFYKSLDANFDDTLSYGEWMEHYSLPMHEHSIDRCMRSHFYQADCNNDEILTWREYHNFRFRGKRCVTSAVLDFPQWLSSKTDVYSPIVQTNYTLSVATMSNLNTVLYKKYAEYLLAREKELKLEYGIE